VLNLSDIIFLQTAPHTIALDESTDVLDTAQLLIFIRGIDEHFCITEELLSMESLKGTTTAQDLKILEILVPAIGP